jgi:hypothetical protein
VSVQIALETIWKMLDVCLKGYKRRLGTHFYLITAPNGKVYPALPTGTKKSKGSVEVGHIRKMARHFGILECAEREIPGL